MKNMNSLKKYGKHLMSAGVLSMMCVTAFAVDPAPDLDLAAIMTSAATTIIADLLAMVAAILPITVTLLAASIGIAYGIKFIKKITSKAG